MCAARPPEPAGAESAGAEVAGADSSEDSAGELLAGCSVIVEMPVQWGDLDAHAHVNNIVFFRYFEEARVTHLRRVGFTESYEQDRLGAILHSTSCRFRRPVFHPDTVIVGTCVTSLKQDRFEVEYRAVSRSQRALVAQGTGIIVSYDYEHQRKAPLPATIRQRILQLDGDWLGP